MAESWVNAAERIGVDLHLELSGSGSRRGALTAALREAVRSGRLAPGTRLPPYRALAADLGVARNTVADAYAELVAEGWLTARQGSGTRVAERAGPPPAGARRRTPEAAPVPRRRHEHELRQGSPDASAFPRAAWAAAYRRALNAAPAAAFGPGDPQGRIELRTALAEYLARSRGVRTDPGRIVICAGFAHALRLLCDQHHGSRVLRGPLAVEAYGLPFHRGLLAGSGVRTVPLPVDEHGARVAELEALGNGVRGVLLTPAHQFPTGGPLHHDRRAAVVDWARRRGGLVVEDDYDGEFRYDRKPVGAVQGLDPERVVYVGSVSKSLSPALRLGWMVLPGHLVRDALATKGEREGWSSALDQLALAEFLSSGAYDRHVRRMRQRYRSRRDLLVTALAERAPWVEVSGVAAGLHAVVRLPSGREPEVVAAARAQGIAIDGLADFRHPGFPPSAEEDRAEERQDGDGLVVGYAAAPERAYGAAVEALCGVLARDRSASPSGPSGPGGVKENAG
ncbi:PLP-dependent aminotransferase family protein [Streptomyces sp. VRA16 Mangrove soil]|uniref:MocR-like pyridoxine biosynthesis transcription factor PdxR n=1 Tax=Streptomyces sp. VRA16 Mangrove soil TaxID=2817434 RepID=UPI001A9E136E|nr:PLP-dependent aminotransferase family protein [Streptomyces sp. VRA16 Mangrove soil]MBO1335368.1 PLP-dependent aminotransferase family protein [Streptomyces sp. VRA16 Mangrove soil]